MFDLLAAVSNREELTAANLTIREQARLAENPNDLRWIGIAPRVETRSIKISEITKVDFRAIAGRRAWDAGARELAERLGPAVNWRIMPMGAKHTIDEEQLQLLRERTGNLPQLIQAEIVKDVTQWPSFLSDAVDRSIEVELFEAWMKHQITVKDPETSEAVVVDLQFDDERYPVEGTAWNDAGINAYDRFRYHLKVARRKIGSVGGVRLRQVTLDEVLKDAPVTPAGYAMTMTEMTARLREEVPEFKGFITDERTYDANNGTGAVDEQFYVPTGRVAFQPADGRVGNTHFAPVTRAFDYVKSDKVSLHNVTVFHYTKNEGKSLVIEAEALPLPLPDERRVYVVNAGY